MKTIKYCPICKRIQSTELDDYHNTLHWSEWESHRKWMIEIEDLRWEPVICRDLYWYFVWTLWWKDWQTLPSRFGKWEPELINYI